MNIPMYQRPARYGGELIGRDLHRLIISQSRRTVGQRSSQGCDEIGRDDEVRQLARRVKITRG